MNLHVVAYSVKLGFWKSLEKVKNISVQHHEATGNGSEIKGILKKMDSGDFLYIEEPLDLADAKKLYRFLSKQDLYWGLLDPLGRVDDPAELFFFGACDYLSPVTFAQPLPLARFKRMCQWGFPESIAAPDVAEKEETPWDWNQALTGQEYQFFFLLISLGDVPALKKRFGETRFNQLRNEFRTWLGRVSAEEGGQLWMDMDTSFLVLFPDTGSFSPLVFGFKTLLARMHLGFEYFRINQPLDLVMATHRGTATWRPPGDTGTVVSDAINSVFHLGQKFAPLNTLSMTSDCLTLVPPSFRDLLVEAGNYEGRSIHRFKKIQFCHSGQC